MSDLGDFILENGFDAMNQGNTAYQLSHFWAYIVSPVLVYCSRLGESMTVWVWYFFLIQVSHDDFVLSAFGLGV